MIYAAGTDGRQSNGFTVKSSGRAERYPGRNAAIRKEAQRGKTFGQIAMKLERKYPGLTRSSVASVICRGR